MNINSKLHIVNGVFAFNILNCLDEAVTESKGRVRLALTLV